MTDRIGQVDDGPGDGRAEATGTASFVGEEPHRWEPDDTPGMRRERGGRVGPSRMARQ